MSEDRSLDEFVASTDDDAADDGAVGSVDDDPDDGTTVRSTGGEGNGTAIDPRTTPSTSSWASEAADCGRCGDAVTRRWRDDGALVCADCKRWSPAERGDAGGAR